MAEIDGRLLARFSLDPGEAPSLPAALAVGDDDLAGVLEALAAGAHPPSALRTARGMAERAPDEWHRAWTSHDVLRRLAVVSGASPPLGDLVVSSPQARAVVRGDLAPWTVDDVVQQAVDAAAASDDPAAALAVLQRLGTLRVALRDLLGMADTPTAAAELSALAEGIVAAALRIVAGGEPSGLTVVAMGKLGGRELNYVSDIDLVFVSADGDGRRRDADTARALLHLLGRATGVGRTYEVDTNLRPEGRDGALVRSLDSYASYYDRWAHVWEFQALLKARPIAGDPAVGERFAKLVEPHVWPERLENGAVAAIQKMKGVVERSADVRRAGANQLKLAPGGLRDIEFAVQLLQLVHGRADTTLRSPNTLDGLAALAAGGYVDEGDANLFGDAYQFLRTVEHRVQLRRLRRSHVIPAGDEERARLARACGFRDIRAADARTQFERELGRVQGYVRRLHEKLFYRPLLTRFGEAAATQHRVLSTGLDEEAARDRLSALGFASPGRAVQHLDALVTGTNRLTRVLRNALPAILPALAAAPDPDGGLVELRSLCDRLAHDPTLLNTLRDAPPSGELLAMLLGRSRLIGEWLVRDPDLIGRLGDPSSLDEPFDADAVRAQIDAQLSRTDDVDRATALVGRRLRRELVWTAIRDLADGADVAEVSDHLAANAALVLGAATRLATDGTGVTLSVIGMGKLGAGELGYASDLDCTLVFSPADARREALAAAERVVRLVATIAPQAPAFTLDLGLRPEGRDGPLARTVESYARYYERWAQPWEFLALTQARVVAGDAALGALWRDTVLPHVYQDPVSPDRLSQVRTMKARVERERARGRRRNGQIDLKLGAGGLADIEWTVQLLALAHGGTDPAMRVAGTRALIDAAHRSGHLDERQHGWLHDGWRLLHRLRNALYLMGQRHSHVLPSSPDVRAHAAQMLGYEAPGIQELEEDVKRTTRRVRTVHEQVFY